MTEVVINARTDDPLGPLFVVPDELWEETGDPDNDLPHDRLLCTVFINGLPMHLEAARVLSESDPAFVDDGCQHFASIYNDDEWAGNLYAAVGGEGRWQTTRIRRFDADYVLYASPHC